MKNTRWPAVPAFIFYLYLIDLRKRETAINVRYKYQPLHGFGCCYFFPQKKCSNSARPDRLKNKNLGHLFKQTHRNKTTSSTVNSEKDHTLKVILKKNKHKNKKKTYFHKSKSGTREPHKGHHPASPGFAQVPEPPTAFARIPAGEFHGSRRSESDQKAHEYSDFLELMPGNHCN